MIDLEQTFREFVARAKREHLFECPWEAPSWPVKGVARSSDAHNRVLHFCTKLQGVPFSEPFGSFARAMICESRTSYSEQLSFGPYAYCLSALRSLHDEVGPRPGEPLVLNHDHFDRAAAVAWDTRAPGAAANVVSKLAFVAGRVFDYGLAGWTERWIPDKAKARSVVPRANDDRILNQRELAALARLSQRDDLVPLDAIRQCAIDLMLWGGLRECEALTLPAEDLLVREVVVDETGELVFGADGEPVYRWGLRYWPAKGGSGMTLIKALPTCAVPIVRRAIERALRLTQQAREVARFQADHPGRSMLGPPWDAMPPDSLLRADRVADALDLQGKARFALGRGFLNANHVEHTRRMHTYQQTRTCQTEFVRKSDLLAKLYELSHHENCCPLEPRHVPLHECLFVMRRHAKLAHPGIAGTAIPLRDQSITQYLATSNKSNSVFARLGFDEGGPPIRLTSHEMRNSMNHVAIQGGLGDIDLAHWMGRVKVRGNAAYDRRRPEEKAASLRASLSGGGLFSPHQLPAPRPQMEDLPAEGEGAIHVTEIGKCIHDLAAPPCELHSAMTRSGRRPAGLSALRPEEVAELSATTARAMEAAGREREEGSAGAAEWVEAHAATLAYLAGLDASNPERQVEVEPSTRPGDGKRI